MLDVGIQKGGEVVKTGLGWWTATTCGTNCPDPKKTDEYRVRSQMVETEAFEPDDEDLPVLIRAVDEGTRTDESKSK